MTAIAFEFRSVVTRRFAIVISANDSKVGTAAYKETNTRDRGNGIGETVSVSFANSLSRDMGNTVGAYKFPGGIRGGRRIGEHRGK